MFGDREQIEHCNETDENDEIDALPRMEIQHRKQLNLDLTQEAYALLQKLAEESGKNMAEVLRMGLALYGIAQEADRTGLSLGIVQKEQVIQEITTS